MLDEKCETASEQDDRELALEYVLPNLIKAFENDTRRLFDINMRFLGNKDDDLKYQRTVYGLFISNLNYITNMLQKI